jgi:hypothetical protein
MNSKNICLISLFISTGIFLMYFLNNILAYNYIVIFLYCFIEPFMNNIVKRGYMVFIFIITIAVIIKNFKNVLVYEALIKSTLFYLYHFSNYNLYFISLLAFIVGVFTDMLVFYIIIKVSLNKLGYYRRIEKIK